MAETKDNFQWYVLVVWRGKEAKLVKKIQLELEQRKLRKEEEDLSLKINKIIPAAENKRFRGLLYCELNISWELVRFFYSFLEVIGFLEHSRSSLFLPKFIELDKFKILTEKKNEPLFSDSKKEEDLNVGDWVKITEGPFASYEGKVVKVNNNTKEISVNLEYDGKVSLTNDIYLEKVSFCICSKI